MQYVTINNPCNNAGQYKMTELGFTFSNHFLLGPGDGCRYSDSPREPKCSQPGSAGNNNIKYQAQDKGDTYRLLSGWKVGKADGGTDIDDYGNTDDTIWIINRDKRELTATLLCP